MKATGGASWFETAQERLLTIRTGLIDANAQPKKKARLSGP
jgi:hypothetical protein